MAERDELFIRILGLMDKWGDPATVGDVYYSLQGDYSANAPTRAQIKTRLEKIAALPGYEKWKMGRIWVYGRNRA